MQLPYPPTLGRSLVFTQANPAAGAEIAVLVPSNAIWQIIGIQFLFTSAIAVANRNIMLEFTRAGGGTLHISQQFLQVASLAITYNWYHGAQDINTSPSGNVNVQLPPFLILHDSDLIETITASIAAADQYSATYIWVQEWLVIG